MENKEKSLFISIDHGSFRDPAGFVFSLQGEIYRALDANYFQLVKELIGNGILDILMKNGYLVPTKTVPEDGGKREELNNLLQGQHHFLHHMRIPFITYPYEWTFSMLVDAAKLHIDIQSMLIENGYSLKDATAFNVQFVYHKPIFIDILSIERPSRLDVWIAYGQFCKMFLYPLLLKKYKNIDLKLIFLGDIDGIDVDKTSQIFGWIGSLRPSLFFDVCLQHVMNRLFSNNTKKLKNDLSKETNNTASQKFNLNRLSSKIEKIGRRYKKYGQWASYFDGCKYPEKAQAEKTVFIEDFLKKYKPPTVLDIGANIGHYSLIAARSGSKVVAIDSDHDCIDTLYIRAKKENLPILPLVMNIASPSPPMGFCNVERKSFVSRIRCQCVFALALVHHLLVTSRIPLEKIRNLLYDLTEKYLVIEFVSPFDEMFQRLLATRENIYGHLTLQYFISVFSEKFHLISQKQLTNTERTLFTYERKS